MTTRKFSNLFGSPVIAAGVFTISAAVISPLVAYWLPEKSQKQQPVVIVPQLLTPSNEAVSHISTSSMQSSATPPLMSSSVDALKPITPVRNESEEPLQTNSNGIINQAGDELLRLRRLSHLTLLNTTNATLHLSDAPLGTYGFAAAPSIDAEGRINAGAIVLKQSSGDLDFEYHKKSAMFGMTSDYIVGFTNGHRAVSGGLMNICHMTLYNKPVGAANKAEELNLDRIQLGEKWQIEKTQNDTQVVAWQVTYSQP